ncbi:hypothetical protein N8351_06725 [Flavobacteriaceae bacterium]|nr:hypothetical protein [Flavobacteriaceae bacterium]
MELDKVFILHKGKKYTESDLDLLRIKLSENYTPSHNYNLDEDINIEEELSSEKKEELKKWRINMKASSWKSRQRGLRKKGKLKQHQIDSLNRLGMLWDPKESSWEKKYVIFKKNGLCDEIEEWVKEQRELYNNNKILNENLIRLKLLNFPFEELENESFPFTFNSLYELSEKLRKKKRRLELKLIKNPPKKLNAKQKEIIKREKDKEKEKKKKKNTKKSKWAVLHSKYVSISGKIIRNVNDLSFEESKRLIEKIEKGESIFKEEVKKYLDNLVAKKKFTKYSLLNANKPGHYFGLAHHTSFLDELRIYSDTHISDWSKYSEISLFINSKDYKVQCYACNTLFNYFKVAVNDRMKKWEPLEVLIKIHKIRGESNQLTNLKEKIKGIPLLYELYKTKIDKTLYKMSKP